MTRMEGIRAEMARQETKPNAPERRTPFADVQFLLAEHDRLVAEIAALRAASVATRDALAARLATAEQLLEAWDKGRTPPHLEDWAELVEDFMKKRSAT